MNIPKPKRADGKINLDDENSPAARKAADSRAVSTEKDKAPVFGTLLKAILGFLILAITTIAAGYVIVVATIAAFPTINDRPVLTVRGAYPIAQYPVDSLAVVNPGPVDRSVIGNVDDILGIPGASVVQIIGGPFGQLATNSEGIVTIDEQPTSIRAELAPQILDNAYFVKCVAGDCGEPGSLTFVPVDYIIGEAKGYVGVDGVKDIPVPTKDVYDPILPWTDRQ